MADINISYDLLFDILRYEKSREELQAIDSTFYEGVYVYLQNKEASMLNAQTPVSERELTRIQVNNVKRLLSELYDRREKKIINLAIYKLKTGSSTINTDVLLPEEKPLFGAIYTVLSKYKDSVINNILNNRPPLADMLVFDHMSGHDTKTGRHHNSNLNANLASTTIDRTPDNNGPGAETEIRSIRFIRPVPRFLGPELETYGPFEQDDIASLPSNIARILVSKMRAEEINME
jgi:DNA replication initiation complex subunit (GINS family)